MAKVGEKAKKKPWAAQRMRKKRKKQHAKNQPLSIPAQRGKPENKKRKTKSSPKAAFAWMACNALKRQTCLLFGVAVAEALDAATHIVHRLLRASVERVRFAGSIKLEQWQLATIVEFHGFFGGSARTGYKLKAVRQVYEADFAVIGVNAFFHGGIS